ncbi:hypothetical protein ACFYU9_14010 [Streptomyces sp. NPDC004327]|uniref:hypothetical protein n=1 Tax=unclassified Streptomyces TaxID=2593676 RepID=UPI00369CED4F
MSVARRPLITATAAGTLLFALWFVPNANASGGGGRSDAPQSSVTDVTDSQGDEGLAETGGPNSVPYLLGGTLFLGTGAGFVTLAMRRGGRAS